MSKNQYKGIPAHVVAKLDLPDPPEGMYWKLIKDWHHGTPRVFLKQRRCGGWLDRTVADLGVYPREARLTLEDAFRHAANDCLDQYRLRMEVEVLWG